MLFITSRADGPRVTADPLISSSENLSSVFPRRPGGLKTRRVESAPEAPNWEVARRVFLRVSGNRVSRASRTDLPEDGWMTRENPSLPDTFVFSRSVVGFGAGATLGLGGGGGFFSPSRQLLPVESV